MKFGEVSPSSLITAQKSVLGLNICSSLLKGRKESKMENETCNLTTVCGVYTHFIFIWGWPKKNLYQAR